MNNFNTFHRAFVRFGFTQKTFFHTSPNKINVKKFARLSGLSEENTYRLSAVILNSVRILLQIKCLHNTQSVFSSFS